MGKMHFIQVNGYKEDHIQDNLSRESYHTRNEESILGPGLPTFRKKFSCLKSIKRAYIHASALGVFEIYMNGERVGTYENDGIHFDELKPGFTDFRVTAFSYTYDLLPYIKHDNTLVAVVSEGWWAGRISMGAFGKQQPAFAVKIEIEYEDGSTQEIETDEEWDATIAGPVLFADIYDGETIDARMPEPYEEWTPYVWNKAISYSCDIEVKSLIGPPVRIVREYQRKPISAVIYSSVLDDGSEFGKIIPKMKKVGYGCERSTLYPGDHMILDLGQNMVGRPEISLSTSSSAQVKVLFAEMLNDSGLESRGADGPEGSIYVKNYRSARATICYTANGSMEEIIYPLHTFFGFRYLDISCDQKMEIEAVHGIVLTSKMKETGKLVTDSERLNQLISNVEWGRRSNYLHVPTDCPQRDERQGWSGDTQVFAGTAAYLSDIRGFMNKWLSDCRDSQKNLDGYFSDVAPHTLSVGFNSMYNTAGWTDAAIFIPEVLFQMYGDTDILREHYSSLEWYMSKLEEQDLIGPGAKYSDWLAYEPTSKEFISLAYFIHDCDQMAKNSQRLSLQAGDFYASRADHYRDIAKKLRDRFNKKFVVGEDLLEKTQTTYVLSLYFKLVPCELLDSLSQKLRRKIEENDYKLSTGFLGTSVLLLTLSEYGMNDLAYSLLLQTQNPSWLYSVIQGATTVWERWNSYTKETGFGDVGMNSFNHYAYGCVLEWLYRYSAGIMPDEEKPGFEHFILAPTPDTRTKFPMGQKRLEKVSASYDSISGKIVSEWYYRDGEFTCHFEIPQNTSATIRFPIVGNSENKLITINGISYWIGELAGQKKDEYFEFELPAGDYRIS